MIGEKLKTRECIIKGNFWFGELEAAGEGAVATALVSDIFDEVESRVCINCKHKPNNKLWCDILQTQIYDKFGCTEFKRKTK